MRFEYLILLIILFNVLTAMAQKRARKAREAEEEEALRGAGGQRRTENASIEVPDGWEWGEDDVVVPQPAGEDVRRQGTEVARTRHEEVRRARNEMGHSSRRRADTDDARRVRDEVRDVTANEETRGGEARSDGLAAKGKSWLERVARDLGIEIPESEEEGAARRREARRRPLRSPELGSFERIKPTKPVKPVVAEAVEARTHAHARPVRIDLSSAQKLREAVVLREVLGPPVARRDRRQGLGPTLGT